MGRIGMHNSPPGSQTNKAPSAAGRPRPLYVGSEVYRRKAFGSHHPLRIMRHSAVLDLVTSMGWLPGAAFRDTVPATFEQLLVFHDRNYLEALQYAESAGRVPTDARERYNIGTMENPVFDGLFERAAMTVGGSVQAARLALEGHIAFHPSGGTHHGRTDRASGFCYFNDPVFAILTLLDEGAGRVMYIDLDAHHGDGVEDAFAADARVLTLSIHEMDRWPYSGTASDPGRGIVNLPVARGFNDSELEYLVDRAVMPLASRFDPDAFVLCCGADSLEGDPLSGMMLSNVALWDAVIGVLERGKPTVVLGGGGYNPWTVTRYWGGLWARINGLDIPGALPDDALHLLAGMECDLVDDEDINPAWLTTIADSPNPGTVREETKAAAREAIRTSGTAEGVETSEVA